MHKLRTDNPERPIPLPISIEQASDNGGRHYRVTGDYRVDPDERLPSVTQVLGVINKPALVGWASKVARETAKSTLINRIGSVVNDTLIRDVEFALIEAKRSTASMDFGTFVHSLIERNAEERDVPAPYRPPYLAWKQWLSDSRAEIIASETPIYHPTELYAGTIDATAVLDGNIVIIDYKTSNRIWDEMALQLSAYAMAYSAHTGISPRAMVLQLPKFNNGCGYTARYVNIPVAYGQFKDALNLYRSHNAHSEVWE